MNIPGSGKDFFAENRKNARNFVHPEDQDMVVSVHYKDTMLKNLSNSKSFSIEYRFIFNERVIHVRQTEIMAEDKKHIIVCIKNIEADVRAKLELTEKMQKSLTFTQIAESLASHYDMIYYVNAQTSYYKEFSTHKLYGELEISEEGEDFFTVAEQNADRIIHPEDRERLKLFINKDNLITQLENSLRVTLDYRMKIGNGEPQYTRMTVSWSSDKTHIIICIENREAYVKKEQEHIKALNMANETARRDSLTGTRNITAFREFENEIALHRLTGRDGCGRRRRRRRCGYDRRRLRRRNRSCLLRFRFLLRCGQRDGLSRRRSGFGNLRHGGGNGRRLRAAEHAPKHQAGKADAQRFFENHVSFPPRKCN